LTFEGFFVADEVESFLERLPTAADVRREIARNLREGRLLRQVLKLAEQREKVEEVSAVRTSRKRPSRA
jgi:hypothetical protein